MINLYISVKKSCLIRAAIQGNPEKKSYSVKGKENLQDQKCVNQKGSVRSTCCHGQIENGKYFRGKKEIPSNLRSESLFFCKKRKLGGETPTMVFKKYHVVEPTIGFFRLRFSNNTRPLSCSPYSKYNFLLHLITFDNRSDSFV